MKSLDLDYLPSEVADSLLNLQLDDQVVTTSSLMKSFYDIDLTSPEGVTSFLTILPVVSEEVLKQAVQTLWPGYPVDEEFDAARHRFELRGYLLDYLDEYESESAPEELEDVQEPGSSDTGSGEVLL